MQVSGSFVPRSLVGNIYGPLGSNGGTPKRAPIETGAFAPAWPVYPRAMLSGSGVSRVERWRGVRKI